jgi:hypothetical protein
MFGSPRRQSELCHVCTWYILFTIRSLQPSIESNNGISVTHLMLVTSHIWSTAMPCVVVVVVVSDGSNGASFPCLGISPSAFRRPKLNYYINIHFQLVFYSYFASIFNTGKLSQLLFVSCMAYSSILKMEAIYSSETSVLELHGVTIQKTVLLNTLST